MGHCSKNGKVVLIMLASSTHIGATAAVASSGSTYPRPPLPVVVVAAVAEAVSVGGRGSRRERHVEVKLARWMFFLLRAFHIVLRVLRVRSVCLRGSALLRFILASSSCTVPLA